MTAIPRLLVTIPHFFNPDGDQNHGSTRKDPRPRLQALTRCIAALHQTLGSRQGMLQIVSRTAHPANQAVAVDLDVVVCTTGDRHLIDQLPLPPGHFTHEATAAEPKMLGFECHRVLRDRFGAYDWYAFLEDDLILHDPWTLAKLDWFGRTFGPQRLLQPNRYEVSLRRTPRKLYIDGDLRKAVTDAFCPVDGDPELAGDLLGRPVHFRRALNPHSGCFFLSAEQMGRWIAAPHFLDCDTRFISPLESAASLGIMRSFRLYKPVAANAAFLEIQHESEGFLSLVGNGVAWRDDPLP